MTSTVRSGRQRGAAGRFRRPAPCCPPTGTGGGARDAVARVALVGNPNVGKSTLFNALTGARQQVGNWPGKTISVAAGRWSTPAGSVELVDLPGAYSLVARSPDEELVRDLLVDPGAAGRPDVAVVALDAANLARNLYLLCQLLDTGMPVVAALTMTDLAARRDVRVHGQRLSQLIGVPVVEVSPRTGTGLDRLAAAVARAATGPPVALGSGVEAEIAALAGRLGADDTTAPVARWLAISMLTGTDAGIPETLRPRLAGAARRAVSAAAGLSPGDDLETAVAEVRHAWIRRVVAAVVSRRERLRPTASDRVDRVLTSRWLGLPIFLGVMWAVFEVTNRVAAPLQDAMAALADGPARDGVGWLLRQGRVEQTWFGGFALDGLVVGVGQLLTFTPLMAIMFVLLTLLEDSGYLARAALVADRLLRLVGLPGQAFLPLIVGFGCNVPAVAGTRILPDARHRLMTVLLVPFVSCSARLTVYVLLANVFFASNAGTVVFAMYVASCALVVGVGVALRHIVFRRHPPPALLLELPAYRRPTARVVAARTWQRLLGFLRTASGIIIIAVTAVWLLTSLPTGDGEFGQVPLAQSWYAGVSRAAAPAFAPAGFADWHATGALVTGFVAKEAVVTTFAQTYGAAEPATGGRTGKLADELRATFDRTSSGHPGAAILAFLIFLLAYTPCMATLAAQRAEVGLRWTCLGIGLQLTTAWLLATAVFQIGRLVT